MAAPHLHSVFFFHSIMQPTLLQNAATFLCVCEVLIYSYLHLLLLKHINWIAEL